MRSYKIVSFSVVVLLITVVFAGAVTVSAVAQSAAAQPSTMQYRYDAQHTGDYSPVAGPVPSNGKLTWNHTTGGEVHTSPAVVNGVVYVGSEDNKLYALNATAPSSAHANQTFAIGGRLTANGTGVGSTTVTLQRSKDNVTFVSVSTNTTNGTGWYAVMRNESVVGKYYYQAVYGGNTTYANATSAPVKVTVTYPAALAASAPATAAVNTTIAVTGNLTSKSTALANRTVVLQRSLDNTTWANVTGASNVTNSSGGYHLTTKEPTTGTYYYRASYVGNATYAAVTSKGVKVLVS